MLDAGRDLLMEAAAEVALRSLTVRAVTKRAEKSSGAFYHYWETQADFIRELLTTLLDSQESVEVDPAMSALCEADVARLTFRDVVDLFEMHVAHQATGTEFRIQLLASSMPEDAVEMLACRKVYDSYRAQLAEFVRITFDGQTLRGGVSHEQFAVMIAAVGDGAGLRRRVDPVWGGEELARQLITALFVTFSPGDESIASLEAKVERTLAATGRPA